MMATKNVSEASSTIRITVKKFKLWPRPSVVFEVETEYPSDKTPIIRTLKKGDTYNYTLRCRAEV